MTSLDVFKCAERIEAIAAMIYASCRERFGADDDAQALFARLEAEELQHAARIRLLAASYRSDRRLLGRYTRRAELEACLRAAERALAEVSGGEWGQELAAVKARLAALELQLMRAHAQAIAEDGDPAIRSFFRQLARQDEAHVELLRT